MGKRRTSRDSPRLPAEAVNIKRLHINCDMSGPVREILSIDPRDTRKDLTRTQRRRRRGIQHKSNERLDDKYETMYMSKGGEQGEDITEGE